jgi:hypothetical protein
LQGPGHQWHAGIITVAVRMQVAAGKSASGLESDAAQLAGAAALGGAGMEGAEGTGSEAKVTNHPHLCMLKPSSLHYHLAALQMRVRGLGIVVRNEVMKVIVCYVVGELWLDGGVVGCMFTTFS